MLSEEYNIEGYVVSVKKRLAEGGFGFIDLVNKPNPPSAKRFFTETT